MPVPCAWCPVPPGSLCLASDSVHGMPVVRSQHLCFCRLLTACRTGGEDASILATPRRATSQGAPVTTVRPARRAEVLREGSTEGS